MKNSEMRRFGNHIDKYFEQQYTHVFHPTNDPNGMHIDVLLYEPTDKYPFWKLVTMGASDFKMPRISMSIGRRNEYMMFVSPDVDMKSEGMAYVKFLLCVAYMPIESGDCISYGHTMEWEDTDDLWQGAVLLMPEVIESAEILRCKLGLFKECVCLQVMPISAEEIVVRKNIGAEQFTYLFYPEDGNLENARYIVEKR